MRLTRRGTSHHELNTAEVNRFPLKSARPPLPAVARSCLGQQPGQPRQLVTSFDSGSAAWSLASASDAFKRVLMFLVNEIFTLQGSRKEALI